MKIYYQTGDIIYVQAPSHLYIGFIYFTSNTYFFIYYHNTIKKIPLQHILQLPPSSSYHYRRLTTPLHKPFYNSLSKLLEHNTYINIYNILLYELHIQSQSHTDIFKSNLFIYYIYNKMNVLDTIPDIHALHSPNFFFQLTLKNNILLPQIHLNI